MLVISEIFIYPIKSLGGIAVNSARVTDRGFEFDRRWMLVDSSNSFLTQREFPQMALLRAELSETELRVVHRSKNTEAISLPLEPPTNAVTTAQVWGDRCKVQFVSPLLDEWFSDMLSLNCRLVYMPDSSRRRVDNRYAHSKEITSLSDGYPFLIIGQFSLDDLNTRLSTPIPMNRFRPNMVFEGGAPFLEDEMKQFSINDIKFFGVKKCGRCVVTTINQENATKSKEPLKTLSAYRLKNNKIYFGMNLLHQGQGVINIGDVIQVQHPANIFTKNN